ncbi:MAG: hypothetical protein P8175_11370 [Deltaproteobacteria bacterium]
MIRVLHIHTLPVISGSGINTFLSMRGMDKSRYAVELAVAPGASHWALSMTFRLSWIYMPFLESKATTSSIRTIPKRGS